ncbi:MAG TPA: Gfo/Idh/MocA family oxidoreductase [Acidimicrobiia bacterium]|nr:Gfo/Idh/MocA family oxidoreductase [Acidimicrobiia bacterium]
MMRIGLVGCGHIGTVHAYALQQLHDAQLVDAALTATFDTDASRAARVARHHGGEPAASLEALLDAVDVVWVCTWTAGHLEVVDAAATRGLPIFCEKPLARTLAECEQVASALRRVPHQVGLVLRWSPVFARAAEIVHDGRFGAVLGATLRDDQYFPIQGLYGSTWRKDAALAGGGTLLEHSIHDVDVLRWLLGDPDDVTARVASRFGHEGIDDAVAVTFAYPGEVVATLTSIWHQVTTRESSRRLEVFCEDALLWTDDDYLGPLHVHTASGEETVAAAVPGWADQLSVPEVFAKAVAHYAEPSKAFLDGLRADATTTGHPDVDDALAAHRLVDAAYRSAAAGGVPQRVTPAVRGG